MLGKEAFPIYFGGNLFDWSVHSLTFASIPIALGFPGSIPFDFIPVRYRTGVLVIRGLIYYLQLFGPFFYILTAINTKTDLLEAWKIFPPPPCKVRSAWSTIVKLAYLVGTRLNLRFRAIAEEQAGWPIAVELVTGEPFRGQETRLHRSNEILQIEVDEMNEESTALGEEIVALAAELAALEAQVESLVDHSETAFAINVVSLRRSEVGRVENELLERRRELAEI